jgi:hypothetical protein
MAGIYVLTKFHGYHGYLGYQSLELLIKQRVPHDYRVAVVAVNALGYHDHS